MSVNIYLSNEDILNLVIFLYYINNNNNALHTI